MVSKSFKVLEIIDGHEHSFSSFAFKATVRKYKAEKRAKEKKLLMN